MQDTHNPSPAYVEGFNQGYYLAKHTPDLAEKLVKAQTNNERLQGMKEGIDQYNLEQEKARTPDWLKKGRIDQTDHSKKHREKGDLDKD